MLAIRLYSVMDHVVVEVQASGVRSLEGDQHPSGPVSLSYRHTPALRDDDVSDVAGIVGEALLAADRTAQEIGGWSLII